MTVVDALQRVFLTAGVDWVLWLLGGLSVASVAVALERLWWLRGHDCDPAAVGAELDRRLAAGEFVEASAWLEGTPAVAARVAAAGLRLAHLGPAAAEKGMAGALALQRGILERRLAYLGTLGNNAPFIGLLGTVIGVIQAFDELGHGAPGHGGGPAAADQVASQAVMSGIAEALVATAVGIAVALPAVMAYNYLQRRVADIAAGAEALSNVVLSYLLADRGGQ
jgi:biopolymer transport protein ExbB